MAAHDDEGHVVVLIMIRVISILILLAAISVWSQSGPESFGVPSKEITIEVDSSQTANKDKSLGLALLGSAVLPGTGEAYLRENKSARNFVLVEVGFWASLFVAWQVRESYLQSGRNYASEFSGVDASGKSAAYLENLASYRSYEEYEHRQDSYELTQVISGVRNGQYDVSAQGNTWDFGSSSSPENTARWREFQSVMRYYRGANVAMSFAVGALALNRVVAIAHTLRVYRRTSGKGIGLHFDPLISPDFSGMRLALAF
ncbi:MAG TPA: hypothetical protein DCQ83_06060 [Fibrobacteres bacterium]|nr:hypothetical protein [Fibrobacterota bacterium]